MRSGERDWVKDLCDVVIESKGRGKSGYREGGEIGRGMTGRDEPTALLIWWIISDRQ